MRKVFAVLKSINRAIRRALRAMGAFLLSPFGGKGGGGSVEMAGDDIGDEIEEAIENATRPDLTPQQRVEHGMEPGDVLSYLNAQTPQAQATFGAMLTMKTKFWLDGLTDREKDLIRAADPQSLVKHLGGIESIKNLRSIGDYSSIAHAINDPNSDMAKRLVKEHKALLRTERQHRNVVVFVPQDRPEGDPFGQKMKPRRQAHSKDDGLPTPKPPRAIYG